MPSNRIHRRFKRIDAPPGITANDYLIETTPVFRKNGMYLDRIAHRAWVECDGQAWEITVEEFFFDFEYVDIHKYTQTELKAIQTLLDYRTKGLNLNHKKIKEDLIFLKVSRSSEISGLRALKRFRDYKKRKGL